MKHFKMSLPFLFLLLSCIASAALAQLLPITHLPGLPHAPLERQWSGYLNVSSAVSSAGGAPPPPVGLWSWFLEKRDTGDGITADDAPLIIWLQGGPGCSSTMGVFLEWGPFKIHWADADIADVAADADDDDADDADADDDDDADADTNADDVDLDVADDDIDDKKKRGFRLVDNPYTWTRFANILAIDQPLGTGWSVITDPQRYVSDMKGMRRDLYAAMQSFMRQFPQFQGRPLFIMGESYGGRYVPNIAYEVLLRQGALDAIDAGDDDYSNDNDGAAYGVKAQEEARTMFNLRGISIGDGTVDPIRQTSTITEQAYQLGLLDAWERGLLHGYQKQCIQEARQHRWLAAADTCSQIIDYIAVNGTDGINIDDVRGFGIFDPSQPMPYYMMRADVQRAFHVAPEALGPNVFSICNFTVQTTLKAQSMQGSVAPLLAVLDASPGAGGRGAGVRVLVYTGQFDLNIGWTGTYEYLRALQWSGGDDYRSARKKVWIVDTARYNSSGSSYGHGDDWHDQLQQQQHHRRRRHRHRHRRRHHYHRRRRERHFSAERHHQLSRRRRGGGVGGGGSGRRRLQQFGPTGANKVAGYSIASQNLVSIMIVGAGHLMPKNQPIFALDLLRRFLRGEKFDKHSDDD